VACHVLVLGSGIRNVAYCESESPRARRSAAASPRQALPCMHASVVGPAAASLSIIARPSFVKVQIQARPFYCTFICIARGFF
jgi:hypothetical protein